MKWVIGIAFALMLISFVSAGYVENDCVDKEPVCKSGYWDIHHHWHCTHYEDECSDMTNSSGYVDADTVQGQDVIKYISDNEKLWSTVGGGGVGTSFISQLLFGDKWYITELNSTYTEYLDKRYCTKTEYTTIDYHYKMLKTYLNFEETPELELKCAQKYGECGGTTCYNGVCLRNVE